MIYQHLSPCYSKLHLSVIHTCCTLHGMQKHVWVAMAGRVRWVDLLRSPINSTQCSKSRYKLHKFLRKCNTFSLPPVHTDKRPSELTVKIPPKIYCAPQFKQKGNFFYIIQALYYHYFVAHKNPPNTHTHRHPSLTYEQWTYDLYHLRTTSFNI